MTILCFWKYKKIEKEKKNYYKTMEVSSRWTTPKKQSVGIERELSTHSKLLLHTQMPKELKYILENGSITYAEEEQKSNEVSFSRNAFYDVSHIDITLYYSGELETDHDIIIKFSIHDTVLGMLSLDMIKIHPEYPNPIYDMENKTIKIRYPVPFDVIPHVNLAYHEVRLCVNHSGMDVTKTKIIRKQVHGVGTSEERKWIHDSISNGLRLYFKMPNSFVVPERETEGETGQCIIPFNFNESTLAKEEKYCVDYNISGIHIHSSCWDDLKGVYIVSKKLNSKYHSTYYPVDVFLSNENKNVGSIYFSKNKRGYLPKGNDYYMLFQYESSCHIPKMTIVTDHGNVALIRNGMLGLSFAT